MTMHLIPTNGERPSLGTTNFNKGHFKSPARILIQGGSNRPGYGIGGWSSAGEGRLVHEGPMVRGPQAYAFQHAGVLDNHGGTGAELRRAEYDGLLFRCKAGDTLVICGIEYTLTLCRRGYPTLTVIN